MNCIVLKTEFEQQSNSQIKLIYLIKRQKNTSVAFTKNVLQDMQSWEYLSHNQW